MYSEYAGKHNVTKYGKTCQKWSSQEPHGHGIDYEKPNSFRGVGDHNYCRNPGNTLHSDNEPAGAWCLTTDPNTRMEHCGCYDHKHDLEVYRRNIDKQIPIE